MVQQVNKVFNWRFCYYTCNLDEWAGYTRTATHDYFQCMHWYFSAHYLVLPVFFQVTTLSGSGITWSLMPCSAQLSSWISSLVFLNNRFDTRYSVNEICVLCNFVVLFCARNIHCMSVSPGRGILPLRLFLRFLPFLSSFKFSSLESRV